MEEDEVLATKILRTINHLIDIEKRRVLAHRNLKLHPSEIHLLLFTQAVQDKNLSEMAQKLGISKGAVSQTISRLEAKGILTKKLDPSQKNEVQISPIP